jgi:uncharacterized protein (TIGR02246 family)
MTTNTSRQAETEIRELLEQRAAATRAKDADAATALFSNDVLTFDVVNPMQHVGVESVRPRTQQWFSSFLGPIGYEMRDVNISAGDDVAFAHLLYRVSGTLASGDELGMWNRATFCFQKMDGAWRIVHEHDSVPFDPATGMASTDLEP